MSDLKLGLRIGAAADPSVSKTVKQVGKELGKAQAGAAAAKDLAKYRAELARLSKANRIAKGNNAGLKKQLKGVQQQYDNARKSAQRYGIDVNKLSSEMVRLNRESKAAATAQERIAKAQEKSAKAQRRREALGNAKGQIAALAGGGIAGAGSVGGAMNSERGLVRLATAVNVDEEGVVDAVKKARLHALKVARETGLQQREIINVNYALNSAGLDAEAARFGAEVTAKVARVTGGMPEAVGEIMATVYNNLGNQFQGNSGQKFGQIADLMTAAQLQFQFRDFGVLGESFKGASSTIIANKMDPTQAIGMLGFLNSAGMGGAVAGTGMTATIRQMSKASKELGFDLVSNDLGGFDLPATIIELNEAIGGYENLDQDGKDQLQSLFGDEGVKALNHFLAGLPKLNNDLKSLASNSGKLAAADSKFINSNFNEFDRAKQNVILLGESIGTALLPVLRPLFTLIAEGAGALGTFIDENERLGTALAVTITAYGVWKAATIASAIAQGNLNLALSRSIPLLGTMIAKTRALSAAQAAGSAGKFGKTLGKAGLVGAAGAAGYGAGTLLYDNVIQDTPVADFIGKNIARTLAFFGNDEAQSALLINEGLGNSPAGTAPGKNGGTQVNMGGVTVVQQPGENGVAFADRTAQTMMDLATEANGDFSG